MTRFGKSPTDGDGHGNVHAHESGGAGADYFAGWVLIMSRKPWSVVSFLAEVE
jgi:hypothetical protein